MLAEKIVECLLVVHLMGRMLFDHMVAFVPHIMRLDVKGVDRSTLDVEAVGIGNFFKVSIMLIGVCVRVAKGVENIMFVEVNGLDIVLFIILVVKCMVSLMIRVVFNLFMMRDEHRVLVMAHHLVLNNRFMVYGNWLVDLLLLHVAAFIFTTIRVRVGVIEGLKDRVLVERNWLDVMLIIVRMI